MAITDNIVFYAKLDEASGNAIDSVNSISGTFAGVTTQNQSGKIGKSVSFNNGYIDFGNSAPLNLTTTGTMSA